MKFKGKDGTAVDGIEAALRNFQCPGICNLDCPLCAPAWAYGRRAEGKLICHQYAVDYPAKAAWLMGYEVVGGSVEDGV